MNQKARFLLGVLSLTGFVTPFGAYVVAANLRFFEAYQFYFETLHKLKKWGIGP